MLKKTQQCFTLGIDSSLLISFRLMIHYFT